MTSALTTEMPRRPGALARRGDSAGLAHHDSQQGQFWTDDTLDPGADISRGPEDDSFGSGQAGSSAPASEKHQPDCALCGLKARMWSGVESWMDELGRWIGWCSKECQRRWLNGERAHDKASAGAQTKEEEA